MIASIVVDLCSVVAGTSASSYVFQSSAEVVRRCKRADFVGGLRDEIGGFVRVCCRRRGGGSFYGVLGCGRV